MPIFGRVDALPETRLIYPAASKPEMFIRVNHSVIGAIVWFLRIGSHALSFADKLPAFRMTGRSEGHATAAGA